MGDCSHKYPTPPINDWLSNRSLRFRQNIIWSSVHIISATMSPSIVLQITVIFELQNDSALSLSRILFSYPVQ